MAEVWRNWQYGGVYPSVKSFLSVCKTTGKWTLRGSGLGDSRTRPEFYKRRHLPEAVEALIKQNVPESEAVGQVDNLVNELGLKSMSEIFQAFRLRQMKSNDKATLFVNGSKEAGVTVEAFDEAFKKLSQPALVQCDMIVT